MALVADGLGHAAVISQKPLTKSYRDITRSDARQSGACSGIVTHQAWRSALLGMKSLSAFLIIALSLLANRQHFMSPLQDSRTSLRLDDPFPLEELPSRVRQIILTEFGGRPPSIWEVANIPDTHWLKVPGMGAGFVALMRSLTRGARRKAQLPSFAEMAVSELQAEYDRLNDEKKAINDQIKAIKAELRVRFKTNCTGPKPPAEH